MALVGLIPSGPQPAASGRFYAEPVQDLTELRALGAPDRADKMTRRVEDAGAFYVWDEQSVAVDDNDLFINPDDAPVTGRWLKDVPAGGLPGPHDTTHENLGTDEINVAGLSGELADPQPPKTHTHTNSEVTDFDAGVTGSTHAGRVDNPHAVAHPQLSSIGENDHHAKIHGIAGAEHLADTFVGLQSKVTDEALFKQSDIADPGNAGRVKRIGGSTFGSIKDATGESADPTVDDDVDLDYEVGSIWLNTTDDRSFICIDNTDGAAIWLRTGQAVLKSFQFFADQLDVPNNADWAVNALAPSVADSNDNNKVVAAFDDTTEEGRGFVVRIPAGAKSMILKPVGRAETGPPGTRTVGLKLYQQGNPDDAALDAWSAGLVLMDIDIPITTEFFQYDSQTIALATLGVVAGEVTHFELTRIAPTGGTDLVGDWNLLELEVDFI